MSKLHGKNTTVLLASLVWSPYLTSADLSVDVETSDTTVFGGTWKTAIAGSSSAKVEVGGYYDPGNTLPTTVVLAGTTYALTVCPGAGATIGDPARLFNGLATSWSESSPVGGIVAVKGSFDAVGAAGFGYMLHPYGEDTNTTTGANRDDGAASATGWILQLHCGVVDGGTWVIKLVDASAANFSDVADVTGATFTGIVAPTSGRVISAAGTTALRQYVRYVATRTGGSAGDGITFALALARNW